MGFDIPATDLVDIALHHQVKNINLHFNLSTFLFLNKLFLKSATNKKNKNHPGSKNGAYICSMYSQHHATNFNYG